MLEQPNMVKWKGDVWFRLTYEYIKIMFHDKILKAPNMMLSKVWQGVHFPINASCPKSNAFPSFHQNWGFQHHFECSLNIFKCQQWDETPYENMRIWETSRITLITGSFLDVNWSPKTNHNLSKRRRSGWMPSKTCNPHPPPPQRLEPSTSPQCNGSDESTMHWFIYTLSGNRWRHHRRVACDNNSVYNFGLLREVSNSHQHSRNCMPLKLQLEGRGGIAEGSGGNFVMVDYLKEWLVQIFVSTEWCNECSGGVSFSSKPLRHGTFEF